MKFKIGNAMENVGEGIMQIMDNCVNIEILEEKSQMLNKQAAVFQHEAKALNNFYKRERIIVR
ncbi:hypothetical protein BEWA_033690 [Theileria equi strain WA]|uniref:Uncharacterized protein n=1 Tax=Theileria equi strain WA TaxID=1537102 RepID=L0B059_THEEQ|nr:hypothetical protein BEWA_033690 [Theileria equi strain WA]AFZ80514.1 hypothetical protein BEWA_033690 [Theileria equi strain WA]|eukprot:XP_004830180.1 hypothetical protein BEWA_033690 [Theileria equi strain WA]